MPESPAPNPIDPTNPTASASGRRGALDPVDTIFFDAGFTLLDIQPSLGEVYASVARSIGHAFSAERFQEVGIDVWVGEHAERYRAERRSSEAAERESWRAFTRSVVDRLRPEGFDPDFDDWFEALYDRFADPEVWRPMPGAHETLEALTARGFTLGIISNWDARLGRVLEGHGLDRYFRLVLTSAEAGWRKPSVEIFEQALDHLDRAPERSLHVGDSFDDDVIGAKAAGIHPVHLTAKPEQHEGAVDAVRALPELLELLDR